MLKKILWDIETQSIKISGWVLGFTSILFVRFLLESLSSPTRTGIIPSNSESLIHIGLFFLSVTLGTACIVGFFTQNYSKTLKVILYGLPIIWIAPVIDIFFSKGKGVVMAYVRDTHLKLVWDFFTFFGTDLTNGATVGMRIEIAMILVGVGAYLYIKNVNFVKSFFGVASTYILGFILGSLPGITYTFLHLRESSSTVADVLYYFAKIIFNSNIYHNTLHEGPTVLSATRFFEISFDKFMSQILFILCIFFATFLFYKINNKKFISVIKNCRPERLNFYTFSILCGSGFAYINGLGGKFSLVDILGFICLLFAWGCLWMHAVHLNDVEDLAIDNISNKNRPLVKGDLSVLEMKDAANLWLIVGLLGAWLAGFYPFFMSLVYVSASYVYSVPPLRLRRFPLVPSFLIGIACLATILAGFFFVSVNKDIHNFPILLAIGIVVMVTLAINFKDMKDIEGDNAEGIMTLATIFGENAPKVIGFCIALSILLVPVFLSFYFLFIFAVPSAIFAFRIMVKKPYKEKNIFVLRFVFLACIALTYISVFLINKYL